MPDGAQAWKMIKTPGSKSGRIAQACDRCRSKKIKCDGQRPNCSQCLSVGFECKISDKLTRRAFPRGYTESLEDRVRQLESETAKLTHLLELKDEQMDMMNKVRHDSTASTVSTASAPSVSSQVSNSSSSLPALEPANSFSSSSSSSSEEEEEDTLDVKIINDLNNDKTYTGSSGNTKLISSILEPKLLSKAPAAVDFINQLFKNNSSDGTVTTNTKDVKNNQLYTPPSSAKSPLLDDQISSFNSLDVGSRLVTDQLVTTYFQEWHTMYSILDQYSFLEDYQRYVNDQYEDNDSDTFAATLVLVLTMASISKPTVFETKRLEKEWKRILTSKLASRASLKTCQCLALALLYSLHVHNEDDIWYYRGLLISTVQRLGLEKCQSKFTDISYYEQELRRRVYWYSYLLDAFCSCSLGCSRLLQTQSQFCQLPKVVDDDELKNENDAQPAPSCALSVLSFSKILAKIIDLLYTQSQSTISNKVLFRLQEQLENWRRELDKDLKFEWSNNAPAATLAPVHQKSPLLLMMYHYASVLLYIPVLDGTSKSSSLSVSAMQSSKVFLQVFEYLQQRRVVSTLCFNPSRVVIKLSGIVLNSAMDYSKGGALLKEAKALLAGAQDFVYNEMRNSRPGSVTAETYQAFEHACDIILRTEKKKPSTSIKEKKKSNNNNSNNKRPITNYTTTTCANITTPPNNDPTTANIEQWLFEETNVMINDHSATNNNARPLNQLDHSHPLNHQHQHHDHNHNQDVIQPLSLNPDDYMDFWNPVDYLALCNSGI